MLDAVATVLEPFGIVLNPKTDSVAPPEKIRTNVPSFWCEAGFEVDVPVLGVWLLPVWEEGVSVCAQTNPALETPIIARHALINIGKSLRTSSVIPRIQPGTQAYVSLHFQGPGRYYPPKLSCGGSSRRPPALKRYGKEFPQTGRVAPE